MAITPKKAADRIIAGIKQYQPILATAKARDVGEADTVTIIKDMLADIFGYDKYSELTSEHAIRGTFCDLAVKLSGVLQFLIEVKAVGMDLKDSHVKQAVDYAANQGVDWVILTNGINWRVYKITFTKPIDQEMIVDLDFSTLSHKNSSDVESLFLWCKEGWNKSALGEYHTKRQALSRFYLGAMLLTDPVVDVIRRELRRVSPDVKIESEQIRQVLSSEVIKREVMEGEKADDAKRKIVRASKRSIRVTKAEVAQPQNVLSMNAGDDERVSSQVQSMTDIQASSTSPTGL